MGLDTTHGAWNGAYSEFMRWREAICEAAGLGELQEFEGYINPPGKTPKSLASIEDTGLFILFRHSDCDGWLLPEECKLIADSLTKLLHNLKGDYGGHIGDIQEKTKLFINGCLLAYSKGETMLFK